MFCPNCRSEYREGFTRCSDCDIDLVAALPEEPRAERREEDLVKVFETHDPGLLGLVASFLRANSIEYIIRNFGQYIDRDAQFWVALEDEDAARELIRAAVASDDEVASGFAEETSGLHVRVAHYFREGGGKTEQIEEPTWEKVEHEIRTMDPYEKPIVFITSGGDTETDCLAITGGDGVYHLQYSDGDADWHEAVNPNRGDAEIEVWTSHQGMTTRERFTWDTEDALRIAKFFWQKQKPSPDFQWN